MRSACFAPAVWLAALLRESSGLMDRSSLKVLGPGPNMLAGGRSDQRSDQGSDQRQKDIVLEWVGCFRDDDKHDLEWSPDGHFTPTGCMQECLFTRFSYMAMQNGQQCFCGNAYRTDIQYSKLPDDECSAPCSGEGASVLADDGSMAPRRCGAVHANAVYKLKARLPVAATTTATTTTATTVSVSTVTDTTATGTTTTVTPVHETANKVLLDSEDICEDQPTTNFTVGARLAACSELKHYCTNEDYISDMEAACPVTCGLCRPTWMGCFHDDDEEHDFAVAPPGKHTTKSCMQACAGYKYMGLQAGSQCWCGMHYATSPNINYQMMDRDCGDVCHGEDRLSPSRYCGKANVNAVYMLPAIAPPTAAPEEKQHTKAAEVEKRLFDATESKEGRVQIRKLVGCFTDDGSVFVEQPRGTHSTETCSKECSEYRYMALEDGTCWCGNQNPLTAKLDKKPEVQCGDVCHGEAGLFPIRYCGEKQTQAVYELVAPLMQSVDVNSTAGGETAASTNTSVGISAVAAEAAAEGTVEGSAATAEGTVEGSAATAEVATEAAAIHNYLYGNDAAAQANATANLTAPASATEASAAEEGTVEATFAQFDSNHDGSIDEHELDLLYLMDPQQWTSNRVKNFLFYSDANGDGALDPNEFTLVFNSLGGSKFLK